MDIRPPHDNSRVVGLTSVAEEKHITAAIDVSAPCWVLLIHTCAMSLFSFSPSFSHTDWEVDCQLIISSSVLRVIDILDLTYSSKLELIEFLFRLLVPNPSLCSLVSPISLCQSCVGASQSWARTPIAEVLLHFCPHHFTVLHATITLQNPF